MLTTHNVPGAFSSGTPKGEDFRIVLEEIVRIKCDSVSVPRPDSGRWESAGRILLGADFSLAWRCLDAQYWGVAQRRKRIFLIADFAGRSAPSVGEQAYLLPLQLTKKSGRHIPYIYSKEDLSKLFKEIDSLQPSLRAPTKHLVVSVIFRLIYCCGLRPVEARRLRREDVNLFDGTVNILESKGHKDRIVVLSEDMLELCRNYDLRVEKIYPHRKYFFQSPSVRGDGMYSMEWIIPTFRRFLQTAGISGYGEVRPRLYDLRHTFATHRLYQWVKEGKDINACLAYLSGYMGHSNLESTAYYIHLLPTLYTDLPELRLDSSLEMEADLCD